MIADTEWNEQQVPERAVYANYLRVGHNAFEFFLDFGQRFDDSGEEQYHTRIVTSPQHAAGFGETIHNALAEHGARLLPAEPKALAAATVDDITPTPSERVATVLRLLEALDGLLNNAYEAAKKLYEYEESGEPRSRLYRGLYVSEEQAQRLLSQPLSTTRFGNRDALTSFAAANLLGPAGRRDGLDAFDNAVIVLALATEIHPEYGRVFAYLQDDVSKQRPTVQLALDLFCGTTQEQIACRQRFLPAAPLVAGGLLQEPAGGTSALSLSDCPLRLSEVVISYLTGHAALGKDLAKFWPRSCEVQACSALPSCIMDSKV